jgi:hypothetical protein
MYMRADVALWFERNQQSLHLILLVRMQEQMRALPRARCRGLQKRSQLLAPDQLRCFGLCHGCTLFDLAAVTQRSSLEQSHGAVIAVSFTLPPAGRKSSFVLVASTLARERSVCPGTWALLNAGRVERLQQAASSSGGVLTASSAKDYADAAFQRSAFACAHANSPTTQKQHAGHDRTGGSREKLR